MQLADLKYLIAYFMPLAAFFAISVGGYWTYIVLGSLFIAIPIIETLLPPNILNLTTEEYDKKKGKLFFDLLLYLNIPIIYGAIYLTLITVPTLTQTWEIIGIVLTCGVLMSASGINVAHELGHKPSWVAQTASKILYLPCLYMHFFIEHNRGHHVRVATPEDPATSRKNELLYTFWFRSVIGGYLHAWELESRKLKRLNKSTISLHNEMIIYHIIQLAYLGTVTYFFGTTGLITAIAIAVISFLLLETINYIEHYGLQRKKLPSGRYESVDKIHSWNSDHQIGRILLYELTRHSDHHYKAAKPYQTLLHYDASPQLPLGYPGSVMISFFPPLWFKLMNPKVDAFNAIEATDR